MVVDFDKLPLNNTIFKSWLTTYHKINSNLYKNIAVYISGGSDSDIIIDLIMNVTEPHNLHKLKFIFCDVGIEYQATKRHLIYLEKKYGINIITLKPDKSIGITKKEFGVPFISKNVSQNIERLANKNFDFTTTKQYEELITTYP
ncbi:hypothetical protein AN642_02545 [Epulopiscium sp. SCG-B10WGA-EpuloA2]|nr:hypothetical protein AN642_02545 [Epulopiscium sp. SCG-B10WGA-EpuloA2]